MGGTKIVIIVLVLIVVLFVVFTVMGVGRPQNNASDVHAGDYPILDSLSSRFGPKLDAKQLTPSITSFDLARQTKYTVLVAADPDHQFRRARVTVRTALNTACAHVLFRRNQGGESDGLGDPQDSASKDVKNKNDFTMSFPKVGGTLQIERIGNSAPCTVLLQ